MKNEEIYREKSDFVAIELGAMLRAASRGQVDRCEYVREGAVEFVNAYGRDSEEPLFFACVTADSLWAIAKDVMRAAEAHLD